MVFFGLVLFFSFPFFLAFPYLSFRAISYDSHDLIRVASLVPDSFIFASDEQPLSTLVQYVVYRSVGKTR